MKTNSENPILDKPLREFEISAEFEAMCQENNFTCLRDLLKIPPHKLPLLSKSSYRILKELVELLSRHDLLDMLDD